MPAVFFLQREVLGIGPERFSSTLKTGAVYGAIMARPFAGARMHIEKLGEITMSDRHLGRLAQAVGQKLLGEQRDRAERHARNELDVQVKNLPELGPVRGLDKSLLARPRDGWD